MRALCCLLALVTLVVANPFAPQPRTEADLAGGRLQYSTEIYPRFLKDSYGDGISDLIGTRIYQIIL
jgi:hypothetical protein